MSAASREALAADALLLERQRCTVALATAKGEAKLGKMIAARASLQPCRHLITEPNDRAFMSTVFTAAGAEDDRDRKRLAAYEKAQKKRAGVTIGMTQQDVVDSSWGRPRKINRTIYSFGTHEQWVYDGGYLYFENGILRTIQN